MHLPPAERRFYPSKVHPAERLDLTNPIFTAQSLTNTIDKGVISYPKLKNGSIP
jgi:hypothetical protein